MSIVNLNVNGETHTVDIDLETPLLYILRNDLNLNGPRFGCGLGQCGACTVIIEGQAVRSCVVPVSSAVGSAVTTLEGLGTSENPHPIQQAFLDQQAAGCGYCVSGIMMTAKALLDRVPDATRAQLINALDGNLCRCASHTRILKALQQYQQELAV